ncbi:MAG: DUF4296 domain-containing protein [Bacteroidales bacterium]|nr:DUF4296 domain-containing protein [Bacteroidales bacterium]MBR5027976.1 DUF4296 domain-containing protein [Bacteroidales bacterium]
MHIFRHTTTLLLIASAVLFFSCNRNRIPEGVINEKTMIEILTEMHTVDAYFNILNGYECDTLMGEIYYTYDQIFKNHGTTKEAFDNSMDYYSKNPKKYREMYEKVVLNLNKK